MRSHPEQVHFVASQDCPKATLAGRSSGSTIASSAVFYPVAWFNLIVGILFVSFLIWEWATNKRIRH